MPQRVRSTAWGYIWTRRLPWKPRWHPWSALPIFIYGGLPSCDPMLMGGALTTLVHALVISRLDHCNALYVGLPLRLSRKLQMVQNAAARLLSGVRKHQHISPTLAVLHWLPVCFRIDFKVLMITYKALNGLGPQYLADRLLPPKSQLKTWLFKQALSLIHI